MALRPTGGIKGTEDSDANCSGVLIFAYAGGPSPTLFVALKVITYSVNGSNTKKKAEIEIKSEVFGFNDGILFVSLVLFYLWV